MDKEKTTLAIYGIQDRDLFPHPLYVHDHNLTLAHSGIVSGFLQQERISRRKRDNTLHVHLKEILSEKRLLAGDYDLVFVDNVVGRSFISQQGDVRFEAPLNQTLQTDLEKGRCWWYGKEKEAYVLNHELAHHFSCLPFFGNFRENSLLVHFDGGASLSNFSALTYRNGQLHWLEYHWDLKPYSTIYNANALVFSMLGAKLPEQNAVPGKFMGLAGWGTSRKELKDWLYRHHFFQDIWGKTSLFFKKVKIDFNVDIGSFDSKNTFILDVAATLQEVFLDQLLLKLRDLQEQTKANCLYYSGGSALNIVANRRIVDSGLFQQVFIPPCAEDSGLSLGAAAFAEWKKHGTVKNHSCYLNNWGVENYDVSCSRDTIKQVAELLIQEKIIGVCNGYGEAGPRALGNRSILAVPHSKEIAKQISQGMKNREWFRPLAPVALQRNTGYFTGKDEVPPLSKYMLLDFEVLAHKRDEIAGVVHADGTARFQTLFERDENPFLFDLLDYLDLNFGVKALINTSFNQNNEPLVHTIDDALHAAKKMKLDAVVLNGRLRKLNG